MLITTDFSSEREGCKVVTSMKFDSEEELQKVIDMQAVEGMAQTIIVWMYI